MRTASQTSDLQPRAIEAHKQLCRLHFKRIREQLSEERRQEAAQLAHSTLLESSRSARWVLSYASFGGELSLDSVNHQLAAEGRLVLPQIVGQELKLFPVSTLAALQPNRWGVREPAATDLHVPIDPETIDLAFIPGLGFDSQTKHRLGYGKGYYDRLLKEMPQAISWGIGFKEQVMTNLPFSAYDIPLRDHFLF
ncbi:5-formyltetrahydrofolate cyclo-ligase [Candidatus Protochlamydia phocaeensis]|uniref:5-formyltetrahydrofolate cyclo-ligase n=1 Tax=Candidatus Protochlamydia phocaeensis TaxID=1414722 RepID=UPI000838470A|nr:5-formyltetrahydrofolate cyclo-ligase [Candidatus Protochlamydia phocaeensis]